MKARLVLGGAALASLVFPCSCSDATIQDIRNDFIIPERAIEMGALSQLVYAINGTDNLYDIVPDEHYRTIGWIDQGSTEVLVAVKTSSPGSSDDNKFDFVPAGEVIVSFRGSEEIEDWVVNFDQYQVPYGNACGESTLFDFNYPMYQPSETGDVEEVPVKIHRGFSCVFKIYNELLGLLEPLMGNQTRLHVTGHSLGGANAALFASYYAWTHPLVSIYLTTFGAPRCGNRGFKLFFEQIQNLNAWRAVNRLDVVPRIPYENYEHVGHLIWNKDNGGVQAYFRQIGYVEQGFKGIKDYSIALLRLQTVEVLLGDHFMTSIMEWLEAAVSTPSTNFTDAFDTIS